ncbi:hypothetical protein E2C01_065043 [Portunus trituberculatus]|uniref:Secreted protein n=1 Tax=Portunus trituberculatus TaxID=210409 RepID=A0A5B7HMF2_PORTR|nr:hypothetical protein [Portunus trituberculatus]
MIFLPFRELSRVLFSCLSISSVKAFFLQAPSTVGAFDKIYEGSQPGGLKVYAGSVWRPVPPRTVVSRLQVCDLPCFFKNIEN